MTDIKQKIQTLGRTISILHDDTSQTAFLYMGRDTEAWLTLDIEGDVYAESASESGMMPIKVRDRETLRIRLPPSVSARALHHWLMGAQIQDLLDTVHEGHSLKHNREKQREIGHLTDEAEEALSTLATEANNLCTLEVWEADEWLWESSLRVVWPPEKTLQQVLLDLLLETIEREIHIDGDLKEVLLDKLIRDANNGEQLSQTQREALAQAERADEIDEV